MPARACTTLPELSVVVPALNEANALREVLRDLQNQRGLTIEVLVGCTESTDDTENCAAGMGAEVVRAVRGRASQMNAAARIARGDYILFLHADSRVKDPDLLCRALSFLTETIASRDDDRVAGHFSIRFDRTSNRHALMYRYMEEKSALNRPQTTNGDQGLLISRNYFRELGGFDESLPFLEDQRLGARIRETGVWVTLPGKIQTSARRFETEGFQRRHILMAIIMGLHSTGYAEFFEHALTVYRVQHETKRLLLTPFFRLIRKLQRQKTTRARFAAWFRVGRYVRQNIWQLFFFCDVLLFSSPGKLHRPFLRAHDRLFSRILEFPVFDLLATALTYLWVMGVLQPWFRIRDRRELKRLEFNGP